MNLARFPVDKADFDGPVLVTGAGGCIGSWVLALLTRAGVPAVAFDLSDNKRRPRLLIGFAAETNDVVANAKAKLKSKKADWIVANDVSGDVMGGHRNRVHLVTEDGIDDWPEDSKTEVARRLVEKIAKTIGGESTRPVNSR